MARKLFICDGGTIVMPEPVLVLVDRGDGGNLIVNPPRNVWERSELSAVELSLWSSLVAATGKAMLDVLPQLEGGCINYWEAGNWALNEEAEPRGHKKAPEHRSVHLHLLGRSPEARDPSLRWGEAPFFPSFVNRHTWARNHEQLTGEETLRIVKRSEELLREKYYFAPSQISRWFTCLECGYPTASEGARTDDICAECSRSHVE
jgi:hypothetical protein